MMIESIILTIIFIGFVITILLNNKKSKNIIPIEPDTLSNKLIAEEWHHIEQPNCDGQVYMVSDPDLLTIRGKNVHQKMVIKTHQRKWRCPKCGWSSRTFLLTDKQKEEDDKIRLTKRRGLLSGLTHQMVMGK